MILTPTPEINYNFVAGVYAFFAVICILLYIASLYTKAVEGFYIVLAPFIPCFLWSMVVRQRWLQREETLAENKKDK